MTVDLSPVLNVVIQIAALVLMGLAAWIAQKAAAWLHISTQSALFQNVLDAVDRGIAYGQQQAAAKVAAGVPVQVNNAVAASAANYVITKMPDTLTSLGMTPAHVADLVLAKLPPADPVAAAPPLAVPQPNPLT